MSFIRRKITRFVSGRLLSEHRQIALRDKEERRRKRAGDPHRVYYFHQVDDPYSHLCVQMLQRLVSAYQIELVPMLVSRPSDDAAPERERLIGWSRRDAEMIAPGYGLAFRDTGEQPPPELQQYAAEAMAATVDDVAQFIDQAPAISTALWQPESGTDLKQRHRGDSAAARHRGDGVREKLGHYLGATFHYGREWYWGVDRLHYLEQRLLDLGLSNNPEAGLLAPPPQDHAAAGQGQGWKLEFYSSARSPYTAIVFDSIAELCERTGVELVMRPVLPMVMRGLPVPQSKRRYIMMDTVREAQRCGSRFGPMCDPVGKPVERVYSLYPWARERGKSFEWLRVCALAAFAEGIDLGTDKGLELCAGRAGLDWTEAPEPLSDESWRDTMEDNQRQLFDLGLWGVPSFRLFDPNGGELGIWGQDRVWLLERTLMAGAVNRADPAQQN